MPKENYALLLSDLARRSATSATTTPPGSSCPTVRSVGLQHDAPPRLREGDRLDAATPGPATSRRWGSLDEGASLEFSPLLSIDQQTAEAVIKLRLAQVEKMRRVSLDLPAPQVAGAGGNQRLQIEVPQVTMANLHERFRWPSSHVLLLSMGMVATPGPEQGNSFTSMLPSAMKSPPRADALLFVEAVNSAIPQAAPGTAGTPGRVSTASRSTPTFHGRY